MLKKSEVKHVDIPHYEELSVKNIYPMMLGNSEFMSFFPDKYAKGKGPSREYFFNILATLQPEYLWKILEHANKQRMSAECVMQKSQTIHMSEYWQE